MKKNYPEKFTDRHIKNFLNKLHVTKVVELAASKKELILLLPYLGQQSFEIRNRIRSSFQLEGSFSVKKTTFRAIYF